MTKLIPFKVLRWLWPGSGCFPFLIGREIGKAHWVGWWGFLGTFLALVSWELACRFEEKYNLRRRV